MAEKAKAGIKLFSGHNDDSSHEGRKPIGEVVGSFSRVVNGKLQALALTIVDKAAEAFDVCSIEADVDFINPNLAGDIAEITGIALGSSKVDSPAFHGARRLGALQCFGEEDKKDPPPAESKEKKVTFEEVKQWVKDHNVFPRQLFTIDDIKDDREFGKVYSENEALTKDMDTYKNKFEEMEKAGKESMRKAGLSDAKERFEKLIPEGATDRAKAFMKKQFNPDSIEDLSDESLKKIVEQSNKEYSEYAKMFGVEENEPSGGPSGGESKDKKESPVDSAVKEMLGA